MIKNNTTTFLKPSVCLLGLLSIQFSLAAETTEKPTTLSGTRVNPIVYSANKTLQFGDRSFDLSNSTELQNFSIVAEDTLNYLTSLKTNPSQAKKTGLPAYTDPEMQKNFRLNLKNITAGMKEILALSKVALQNQSELNDSILHIQEIHASLTHLTRVPQPNIKLKELPGIIRLNTKGYKTTNNAEKISNATNLEPSNEKDLSLVDPVNSSFWKKPTNISSRDLYYGHDRTEKISTKDQICDYLEPKISWGSHAGFSITCGETELKVKFSDVHVEPIQERIFWALGFNTDPTDFTPNIKLNYNRKILTEINSRKIIAPKLILPVIPDPTMVTVTRKTNAFKLLSKAVLKNGKEISAENLPAFLLNRPMPEWDQIHLKDSDFNPTAEAQIAYLVTNPAQLQGKKENLRTVGPWDWNDLEHENRRDMRGVGLLAAWLNWHDIRYDNNRLLIQSSADDSSKQLIHMISELGSGLGHSRLGVGLLTTCLDPNNFLWKFTDSKTNSDGITTVNFLDFHPLNKVNALKNMNLDDARWMARLIAQLSEKQIQDVLIAGGISSEYVVLYREKLISRRDQMIKDLGLSNEIPALRNKSMEGLNYNPKVNGTIKTTTIKGELISAPDGGNRIENGELVLPYQTAI